MNFFRFSIRLTIAFFIAGVLLLILFYFTRSPRMVVPNYGLVSVAILGMWLFVAVLLFNFLRQKVKLLHLIKTLAVLAINIPVGMAYLYGLSLVLNHARLTVTNKTGIDLERIEVTGCEDKTLNLKSGASKTVYVWVPADCEVLLTYHLNGKKIQKTVIGYLTPNMGPVDTTYEIKAK